MKVVPRYAKSTFRGPQLCKQVISGAQKRRRRAGSSRSAALALRSVTVLGLRPAGVSVAPGSGRPGLAGYLGDELKLAGLLLRRDRVADRDRGEPALGAECQLAQRLDGCRLGH